MKLETQFAPAALAQPRIRPRSASVAAGVVFVVILALYWRTVGDMAAIWYRSETFAHGFLVLPICVWLVWRKRAELCELPARPWIPALAAVAGAGFLWLAADIASAGSAAQFAVVLMLQFAMVAVLGPQVALAVLFPLAFLLFAVPAGESLVPKFMDWTADFTVVALQLSGIPVYREGNYFLIPSGSWSVVEACSGIRYLLASMMAGSLFAYLTYRSPWKRAAFFAASIAVPIVANWLRAYAIVMIGHLSSNRYAVGIDHLIYGWIFFGIVIGIMFCIGSLWREPVGVGGPLAANAMVGEKRWPQRQPRHAVIVATLAIAVAAIWLPIAHWTGAAANTAAPGPLDVTPENGWRAVTVRQREWKPRFQGQRAEYHERFAKEGREVGVYVAYYSHQTQDHELVNSENVLAPTTDASWKQVAAGSGALDWSGERVEMRRAELVGPRERLAVAQVYWISGRYTASDLSAKVRLALQKLLRLEDDSAAIVLYTFQGESKAAAEETLQLFATEMSGAVGRALARASQRED